MLGGCGGGFIVPIPVVVPTFVEAGPAPDALLAQGHRLMEAGDADGALRVFRQAAVTGAGSDALAAMGTANLALGRLGQAEPLLRRAAERDPGSVAAWNNLGVVLAETGRAAEAAASFRRAFALDGGATAGIRDNLVSAEVLRDAAVGGGDAPSDADATLALVTLPPGRGALPEAGADARGSP